MMRKNSSSLTSPSPSRSASSIISWSSSSVMFSPNSLATRFKFLKEIFPVSSSSNSRNAFMISSRLSRSPILAVIMARNSSKSMVPLPSLSMSAIIFLISSLFGSKPRARIATLSSFASMVPLPSVSNKSNASRISCFCSSDNPEERPLPLRAGPACVRAKHERLVSLPYPHRVAFRSQPPPRRRRRARATLDRPRRSSHRRPRRHRPHIRAHIIQR